MRRYVKASAGRVAFMARLYRTFFHGKAVIALFHRIDDQLTGDPITCTKRAFGAYCDFFNTYFTVVSLGDLLDKLAAGADITRHVSITFDDGYRDNFEIAVPELQRRGLPACFFIASDFIGTDRDAPWDAAKGIESRWMTWDQVCALHGAGFEVGAHTKNHVDLGQVHGEEAVNEIEGSRDHLQQALGTRIRFFSYPFGRPENITDDNRAAVRRAGFECCLSAYGGTLTGVVDPFHIERLPISPWFISPFHFGYEAMTIGTLHPSHRGSENRDTPGMGDSAALEET